MIYIGIDPGLSGGVAIISDKIEVFDTPTTKIKSGKKNKNVHVESKMVDILLPYKGLDVQVVMEKVHSMPGQGVAAMFSMGEGYGLWKGILSALRLPYTLVTPQAWKKAMMSGMGKEKAASCYRCQQLFPEVEVFTPRGRALDGRGDALLMAEYCRRNF
jgi:crossover junction endodeoxyribonuclease RuvC